MESTSITPLNEWIAENYHLFILSFTLEAFPISSFNIFKKSKVPKNKPQVPKKFSSFLNFTSLVLVSRAFLKKTYFPSLNYCVFVCTNNCTVFPNDQTL